ncbi:hypothetical protein [Microbulbifer taiwanensis]|uniref:hypothetical protein n=1 Tax=Microbulbifer taiwanensis TaxID=986746 RepID=UPI00362131DC
MGARLSAIRAVDEKPWLALQANILALIWFFLEVNYGFYPALLPLFILSSVYVLSRGRQSIVLLLVVLASTGFWVEYSLAAFWREADQFFLFDLQAENLAVAVALFVLLFAFSHWLSRQRSPVAKDYAAVISIWCLRFALLLMLVLSFAEPWEGLLDAHWNHPFSMWFAIALLGGLALLPASRAGRLLSCTLLLVVFALLLLAVTISGNDEHAIYFQVAANFALVGSGIWLIVRGIHGGISHYFFLGVAAILVTALLRYIDLIGDYMGGALVFTLFAVLLLGAARYWKKHQSGEGTP